MSPIKPAPTAMMNSTPNVMALVPEPDISVVTSEATIGRLSKARPSDRSHMLVRTFWCLIGMSGRLSNGKADPARRSRRGLRLLRRSIGRLEADRYRRYTSDFCWTLAGSLVWCDQIDDAVKEIDGAISAGETLSIAPELLRIKGRALRPPK